MGSPGCIWGAGTPKVLKYLFYLFFWYSATIFAYLCCFYWFYLFSLVFLHIWFRNIVFLHNYWFSDAPGLKHIGFSYVRIGFCSLGTQTHWSSSVIVSFSDAPCLKTMLFLANYVYIHMYIHVYIHTIVI